MIRREVEARLLAPSLASLGRGFGSVPPHCAAGRTPLCPGALHSCVDHLFGRLPGPPAASRAPQCRHGVLRRRHRGGPALLAVSLAATHIPSAWALGASLDGVCAGFFPVHPAAVGSMNRRLRSSRGRGNALHYF